MSPSIVLSLTTQSMPPTPASPASVLPELDLTISPEDCHGAVGLPETEVKNIIRNTAILLYRAEKAAPIWRRNVRNNRHSLRFFISRIEGDQSSNSSSSEAIINPPGAFTAGRQPSTKPPSKLAELAAFEDLYYATCCKIRELYANIALRVTHFGADMLQTSLSGSRGSRTLHDFATILSAHWAFLNDPALITTLASAVRAASSTSLWDTNRLPVGAIMALLWEKQQQQPEPFRVFAARLPRAPANTAKPLPPLPAPARAQRYVVAGGLARLEEREEVVVVVPGLVLPQYESVAVGWEEMEGMVERVVMAERVRRGELGDGEGVERVVEGKRRGFGGWRKMRWW